MVEKLILCSTVHIYLTLPGNWIITAICKATTSQRIFLTENKDAIPLATPTNSNSIEGYDCSNYKQVSMGTKPLVCTPIVSLAG